MGRLTLVTGGARSGKSRHAEQLAAATGAPVVYLATMEPRDAELRERVARHRARRPAAWRTVEAPHDVAGALAALDRDATVLLDCITLWLTNRLLALVPDLDAATSGDWERAIDRCLAEAGALCALQGERPGALIAVTNEVGLGIVPETAAGRYFRDAAGLVNQALAQRADTVILMVSGRALDLPPA